MLQSMFQNVFKFGALYPKKPNLSSTSTTFFVL